MKLTFLPNWCKWLSLVMLISAFIIDFDDVKNGFLDGYHRRERLHME
jgi:hypothetical protein